MAKIGVAEFLALAQRHPVLDVRSPGEYAHAHIPGAISMPLFTDDERKVVGTAYKQQSREDAIKIGLDYYGPKMRKIVEATEAILREKKFVTSGDNKLVLVHCWRGGMRSAAIAWLLELYGFKVCLLSGGYKAFRNHVLASLAKPWFFKVLGGYTGSGKTEVLQEMAMQGRTVLDLEHLAQHKGSAFGGFGMVQPGQEMFENILACELDKIEPNLAPGQCIWLEDESQRIGQLNIPHTLWKTIRQSTVYYLEIPFEERLAHIVAGYSKHKKEELVNAIIRIQKRLGNQDAKNAINCLLEDRHADCFAILLKYYDKYYRVSMKNRDNPGELILSIPANTVNAKENSKLLPAD